MLSGWQYFALGSALFAALTAIFGKLGVTGLNSNLATFFRTLIVLVVSAILITLRQEWGRPETLPRNSILFLILSGVSTGLSWLCYYRALQLGDVSKVASVDKLSVVFVVLFAVIFLGEKLTLKTALGSVMLATGAIIMAL